jgi:hypothetical protein
MAVGTNSINRFVIVMETQCVFWEGTEFFIYKKGKDIPVTGRGGA